jgi:hypothetical protein
LGARRHKFQVLSPRPPSVALPTPRVFCAKSAESLEKKRVEFLWSAKKCKRVRKSMKTKDEDRGTSACRNVCASARSGMGRRGPLPLFFVSADSKEVAGGRLVSAESARLKAAGFSVIWEWLVSADSKRVIGAICLQEGKQPGSADSKGVRRTAWPIEALGKRGRMVRRARKNRAERRKDYNILVPYVNDYFKWFGCRGMALRGSG